MKVLLIGSGGREHALYWKISQSPLLTSIKVLPGNGGFPDADRITDLDWKNTEQLRAHVKEAAYDLVIVGPEDPLVAGIVDLLEDLCPVFGPGKLAAQLEGSKDYSKAFMEKYNIPTAAYQTFEDFDLACKYLDQLEAPYVIKTDGLAAGKGVAIAAEKTAAIAALEERMITKKFGISGERVVIEEFMEGEEASVFALCDGTTAIPFMASQDHKRAYDNDQGPNTGGMGAYLPVPFMTDAMMAKVQTEVLDRAIQGMQAEGHPYKGLLYAGLMVKGDSVRVVEYNIRFGDPETQALMRLVDEDLLPLLVQAAKGELDPHAKIKHLQKAAIIVVLASEGYPGEYKRNIPLKNVDTTEGDIISFHAGTSRSADQLHSAGGRVLGLTCIGDNLVDVRSRLYANVEHYTSDGLFYRTDIGKKGI